MITSPTSPTKTKLHIAFFFLLLALFLPAATGWAQPVLPPETTQQMFFFQDTTWHGLYGVLPINSENLAGVDDVWGNALMLDTGNSEPALLQYNVQETDGYMNIELGAGAVFAVVTPDWSSADTIQNGAGPGQFGYLLAAGDWSSGSPNGFWGLGVDAGGTNIYFFGVSNSVTTTYVTAPISWAANSLHEIGLTYGGSPGNSVLYLDGQWAATGGPVTVVPSTATWGNGFYVGSDSAGYEQFQGVYLYLELDNTNAVAELGTNYFTDSWTGDTNAYDTWLNGPGFSGGFMFSAGLLNSYGSSSDIITGTSVYLTDMSYTAGGTFTFTIQGGANGVPYDVFSTTSLAGPPLSNSVWTWLGQGTNSGTYQIPSQTSANSFYVLGTPLLAPDGSGLTVAYEALIPSWHDNETISPDDVVVGGSPLSGSGSSGTCPGAYLGYVNYLPDRPNWGWTPSTNTTVYTASDTNRTDTKVVYMGSYGDEGCGHSTVTIPYPPYSPVYRFGIVFTNDVPTGTYNITLHGFNP